MNSVPRLRYNEYQKDSSCADRGCDEDDSDKQNKKMQMPHDTPLQCNKKTKGRLPLVGDRFLKDLKGIERRVSRGVGPRCDVDSSE